MIENIFLKKEKIYVLKRLRGGIAMNKSTQLFEILDEAVENRTSDIYFLPQEHCYKVQYYTKGKYINYCDLSFTKADEYINYFKFQANMNISERRRPQAGSWRYNYQNKLNVNCRFSSIGDFLGRESLVIRLIYPLETHGQRFFEVHQWVKTIEYCHRRGLILFSGPTGSGKTTSMYELIRQFSDQQILAIENPIEIYNPDILQLQVNEKAGITYEDLIKVALRHHPEIFVIGEIRDEKTAQAAIQAALSGHLVLSTVHAKSARGVIERLLNLNISMVDLKQTLRLVNYQRLIPDVNNNLKVLFDQLELKTGSFKKILQNSEVSSEWRKKLEKQYLQQNISENTYQKYIHG